MSKDAKRYNRKEFLKAAGAVSVGSLSFLACNSKSEDNSAPAVITNRKKIRWKMVTTWPPNFPILGEVCHDFAEMVRKMSGGDFEIKVYGAGELIPAFECFDAVSAGAVEMASGASYYWAGKDAATQFFTTIPFGLNAQQMTAWLHFGGGYELWTELYDRFGLIPFSAGNTGLQMAGWFNKEINEPKDLKGLKMRIPGLGGKVLQKAGGTAVLSSGAEIYTNLERGVIDAAEWIGPYHDYIMGFHEISKFYYAPGWHEPGSNLEFFANKLAFNKLPEDLKDIFIAASAYISVKVLHAFEVQNAIYMEKIKALHTVDVRLLSDDVLDTLRVHSSSVLDELASKSAYNSKVYQSLLDFKKSAADYNMYSEKQYFLNL